MRIENRIKFISDENEYEKVLNYLLVIILQVNNLYSDTVIFPTHKDEARIQ
jgi:hypothetical protein